MTIGTSIAFFILTLSSILLLIFHISRFFSSDGFSTLKSLILSALGSLLSLFFVTFFLGYKIVTHFNNYYILITISSHILVFTFVYFLLIIFAQLLKFLSSKLDILPSSSNFRYIDLYRNTDILKTFLSLSYFISLLIFIFFLRHRIVELAKNNNINNLSILEMDLKNYYEIFIISLLPILYSQLKNK